MSQLFAAGDTVADWTVIADESLVDGKMRALCQCKCGLKKYVKSETLRGRIGPKCARCIATKYTHLKVGDVYWEWTIVEQGRTPSKWVCKCSCGTVKQMNAGDLLDGAHRGCRKCWLTERCRTGYRKSIWTAVKGKAKTRGIPFDITVEEMFAVLEQQQFRCAMTGQVLVFAPTSEEHSKGGSTASLDRIDASKGYEKGNIQWTHKDVNLMRNEYTVDEYIAVCRAVVDHADRQTTPDFTDPATYFTFVF